MYDPINPDVAPTPWYRRSGFVVFATTVLAAVGEYAKLWPAPWGTIVGAGVSLALMYLRGGSYRAL